MNNAQVILDVSFVHFDMPLKAFYFHAYIAFQTSVKVRFIYIRISLIKSIQAIFHLSVSSLMPFDTDNDTDGVISGDDYGDKW